MQENLRTVVLSAAQNENVSGRNVVTENLAEKIEKGAESSLGKKVNTVTGYKEQVSKI